MTWLQIQHASGAAQDYSLASVLITSPVWAPWLADINVLLTFIGLLIGLVLGARRLLRDFKKPLDD